MGLFNRKRRSQGEFIELAPISWTAVPIPTVTALTNETGRQMVRSIALWVEENFFDAETEGTSPVVNGLTLSIAPLLTLERDLIAQLTSKFKDIPSRVVGYAVLGTSQGYSLGVMEMMSGVMRENASEVHYWTALASLISKNDASLKQENIPFKWHQVTSYSFLAGYYVARKGIDYLPQIRAEIGVLRD